MKDDATIELWQRIATTSDLPKELRDDVASKLDAYDRATELHQQRHQHHLRTIANCVTIDRDGAASLYAQLLAGKKPGLDKTVTEIELARIERGRAQDAQTYTAQAASMAMAAISAGLIQAHREPLFAWVVKRRVVDLAAVGLTEHVTPDVAAVWRRLAVLLYPLPTELELDGQNRLPVVFDAAWTKSARRSLAWVWREIAAGNYVWSPPPVARHKRSPSTIADRLRITSPVFDLPTV